MVTCAAWQFRNGAIWSASARIAAWVAAGSLPRGSTVTARRLPACRERQVATSWPAAGTTSGWPNRAPHPVVLGLVGQQGGPVALLQVGVLGRQEADAVGLGRVEPPVNPGDGGVGAGKSRAYARLGRDADQAQQAQGPDQRFGQVGVRAAGPRQTRQRRHPLGELVA